MRELADGEAVFEVAADYGPGVLVELLKGGSPIAQWALPGTQAPNTNRKVCITFELCRTGGTATCVIDDGLRLETRLKVPPERVALRISTIARTRAIVKNLKVIEVSRPK